MSASSLWRLEPGDAVGSCGAVYVVRGVGASTLTVEALTATDVGRGDARVWQPDGQRVEMDRRRIDFIIDSSLVVITTRWG